MCVDSRPVPDRPNGNFLAKQSFATDRRKSQISLQPTSTKLRMQKSVNEKKLEDFAIEGARWIGIKCSVNYATHQSHQTIELQPA